VAKILFILLGALLTGCSTLPEQYAKSPTRSLIKGVSTSNTEVRIRTVDGGEAILSKGIHLGDKVWLEPGIHKVEVMCTTKTSWGSIISPGEVEIGVQPGYDYFLSTDPDTRSAAESLNSTGKRAPVHVAARSKAVK
jgi:hypothetical protein